MAYEKQQPSRRIQVLRDDVARKIAAGEVIDRPFSVVRELLDNAIDAGATEISLHLESGGLRTIRVADNGSGMSFDDLALCHLPHATSKIETERDLEHVRSLGFRGEALSSIATVSRLEIVSSNQDGGAAGKLVVHAGSVIAHERSQRERGTSVEVADLFYSLPARRRFLKAPGAETGMVRSVLVEKALPNPRITFRFFTDGKLKTFLPAIAPEIGTAEALRRRVEALYADQFDTRFLHELSGTGEGFEVIAVAGTPEIHRSDRKYIQTFVNGRRIWEFAFVQAAEHAYAGYLPGGAHPVCFFLITIDPALVDFNIHPAKKEARFRDVGAIHRRVVRLVQDYLSGYARRSAPAYRPDADSSADGRVSGSFALGGGSPAHERSIPVLGFDLSRRLSIDPHRTQSDSVHGEGPSSPDWGGVAEELEQTETGERPHAFRYLGQLFGLFLLAEAGERLFIVDQHAAHERLIYERLRSSNDRQPLLIPIEFEAEDETEAADLRRRIPELAAAGIGIKELEESTAANGDRRSEGGDDGARFCVTSVPAAFDGKPEAVVDALKGLDIDSGEWQSALYATMSCRAAVMDGDPVDPVTARTLIEGAFALANPRCPHGRPIWTEISRARLFELVGRTV